MLGVLLAVLEDKGDFGAGYVDRRTGDSDAEVASSGLVSCTGAALVAVSGMARTMSKDEKSKGKLNLNGNQRSLERSHDPNGIMMISVVRAHIPMA